MDAPAGCQPQQRSLPLTAVASIRCCLEQPRLQMPLFPKRVACGARLSPKQETVPSAKTPLHLRACRGSWRSWRRTKRLRRDGEQRRRLLLPLSTQRDITLAQLSSLTRTAMNWSRVEARFAAADCQPRSCPHWVAQGAGGRRGDLHTAAAARGYFGVPKAIGGRFPNARTAPCGRWY